MIKQGWQYIVKANHAVRPFVVQQADKAERVTLAVIAALLVAVIAIYIGEKQLEDAVAPHIAQIDTLKKQAKVAIAYSDSLDKENKKADKKIGKLQKDIDRLNRTRPTQAELDSLERWADSVYATLSDSAKAAYSGIIPRQYTLIKKQDSTIKKQDTLIFKKDSIIDLKTGQLSAMTDARDSLKKVLENIPKSPKQPHWWKIPAPSRKTSLLVGIATGAILTAKISK